MSHSSPLSLDQVLESLNEIEQELLISDEEGLQHLLVRLTTARDLVGTGVPLENTSKSTVDLMHRVAHRIQVIAQTRFRLAETFGSINSALIRDANLLLRQHASAKQEAEAAELSEALPAYYMRKHFLATLDDPYPTSEDKDSLIAITNESPTTERPLKMNQLTLWFINARRRSGWSNIMKKFARNDRTRMQLLVQTKMLTCNLTPRGPPLPSILKHNLDDLLRDNLGGKLTAADKREFEDEWASMISWIKYGVKEKVGSWVYDLMAANKHSPSKAAGQQRAVTTAVKRTPVRKTTAQTKPRQAKQQSSKGSSTSSEASTGLESTPELSMCSTADTSFSSFSGNVSMAHYNPFQERDELLESPTLKATAARRVRALPKRAFKLHKEALYTDQSIPTAGAPMQNFTNTCGPLPPQSNDHTLVIASTGAQTTDSHFMATAPAFPPYDALGQVPMMPAAAAVRQRESLSSNSLSAAFG
nr:TPA_inf: bE [Pseudozyma tsukubaensis]